MSLVIRDAIGEVDLAIPVGCWREGEGAVLVVGQCALTVSDFEINDGESVSIGIGGVGKELLG